jgi:hypothetical protein
LAEKETKDIRCPFCGAPYRKLVPPDALQLKCDYCGAIFHIPPKLGVEIPRCYNHNDRFATGICNDCGQSFCSDCLTAFPFTTQNDRTILYLCPNCFRKRNLDKANSNIAVASIFLAIGISTILFSLAGGSPLWLFGSFLTFIGVIWVVYAAGKRSEIPPEIASEKTTETIISEEEDKAGVRSEEEEAEEAERLYDQLFTKYVEHWGIQTGTQLLDGEIRAYTLHGDSYAQAMRKIAERNEMKTR